LSHVIVVCCKVEVSATDRSLVPRSPSVCCVCVRYWNLNNEKTHNGCPAMGEKNGALV